MSNQEMESTTRAASRRALWLRLGALGFVAQVAPGCARVDGNAGATETRERGGASSAEELRASPEPQTLAHGAFRGLAISQPYLYSVNDDTVVRVSMDDGTLESISGALSTPPYPLATDSEYLYGALFIRPFYTEFWRVPLGGGDFDAASGGLLLGTGGSSGALGVNASHLVSLEARPSPSTLTRRVTRFDKNGAGSRLLGTFTSVVTDAFALDDVNAYITRGPVDLDHAEIVRVPLDGGESAVLLAAPSDAFRSIAVAGDDVAFASLERVGIVPIDGGCDVTASSEGATLVLADAQYIYYFTGQSGCESGSILYRIEATGGDPVALAHEPLPGCIREAALADGAVYWLTSDGSRIRKASNP